jgi:hypothetical protein
MDLEALWYEVSPYVYATGALVALVSPASKLSLFFGGLLLLAAGTVIRLRWVHRKNGKS